MTGRHLARCALWLAIGPLAAQADLAALVEQLGSAEPAARSRAYNALLRQQGPELVTLLGARIATFPVEGQQYAIYLLRQQPIDTTRDLYVRLLAAERNFLRAAAAAQLVRHGDTKHAPLLARAVAAAVPAERQFVLNTLWGLEDGDLAAAVRGYLQPDAPAPLVVSALTHLRQIERARTAATTAAVQPLAAAPAVGVRAAALAWLAGGDDGAAPAKALAELLREQPELFWSVDALFEADRKYPAVLIEAFAAALARPRSKYEVARLAARLRTQAPELAAGVLRDLLAGGAADLRGAALEALATLPGGLDQKELQRLLRADAPDLQVVAAATLRRLDDPSGLPVLLELAAKPGQHRAEAVEALGGFRSRAAVETLFSALDDGELLVRQRAWTALHGVLNGLFPYRRFDFPKCGYDPDGPSRQAGIAQLRAWWATVK
ncbi:MAG: hypothetical protein FJ265_05955 [Planctomycetes bacterium]|nr:hypothetical protein [Planctomycetota bacterium]